MIAGSLLGRGLFRGQINTVWMFILAGIGFTMVYGVLILIVFGRTAEFGALLENGKRIIRRKMGKKQ